MWTDEEVRAGVAAARQIVSGDGADLLLVNADARKARIDLRLDVTNLHCDDGTCLLPGRMLAPMIEAKLREHVEGEWELRLEDPRDTK